MQEHESPPRQERHRQAYGEWNAPVDAEGRFVYVPIPESPGTTGCHSHNLLDPKNAGNLVGARLAFVQGGKLGARLVLLTPPITVEVWEYGCETRWMPPRMPFKYVTVPLIALNDNSRSDFPSVRKFASRTRWGKREVERELSSRIGHTGAHLENAPRRA